MLFLCGLGGVNERLRGWSAFGAGLAHLFAALALGVDVSVQTHFPAFSVLREVGVVPASSALAFGHLGGGNGAHAAAGSHGLAAHAATGHFDLRALGMTLGHAAVGALDTAAFGQLGHGLAFVQAAFVLVHGLLHHGLVHFHVFVFHIATF